MLFQNSTSVEDVLPSILVAHGDLGSSCYVSQGAAPQLSALEEDMCVFVTAVVDEGYHEVEASTVPDFYLRRANREGIRGNL